ncbi:MAG: helix-hairpin-helix domain-containing protein [Akkermansiaceae bacterium]|nr:helix-hairpin-helix domain-containing protein [Akkermansiaceae bacterium]
MKKSSPVSRFAPALALLCAFAFAFAGAGSLQAQSSSKKTPSSSSSSSKSKGKTKAKSKSSAAEDDSSAEAEKAATIAKALTTSQKSKLMDLLNKGDDKALASLPGIGETKAAAIKKARPLKSPDELIGIEGIGLGTLEDIVKHAKAGFPEPKADTGKKSSSSSKSKSSSSKK